MQITSIVNHFDTPATKGANWEVFSCGVFQIAENRCVRTSQIYFFGVFVNDSAYGVVAALYRGRLYALNFIAIAYLLNLAIFKIIDISTAKVWREVRLSKPRIIISLVTKEIEAMLSEFRFYYVIYIGNGFVLNMAKINDFKIRLRKCAYQRGRVDSGTGIQAGGRPAPLDFCRIRRIITMSTILLENYGPPPQHQGLRNIHLCLQHFCGRRMFGDVLRNFWFAVAIETMFYTPMASKMWPNTNLVVNINRFGCIFNLTKWAEKSLYTVPFLMYSS
ncbi:hypothetical protein [Acidithiobacillus ferrivorans]|uniref:hypothetical protein n=1 Tax=Acidithiobacillus ferrivorans TaxID=160808 RepID=UPI001E4352C1|nr:hypothetical protein [Acidithiobacillus ferrivorans]